MVSNKRTYMIVGLDAEKYSREEISFVNPSKEEVEQALKHLKSNEALFLEIDNEECKSKITITVKDGTDVFFETTACTHGKQNFEYRGTLDFETVKKAVQDFLTKRDLSGIQWETVERKRFIWLKSVIPGFVVIWVLALIFLYVTKDPNDGFLAIMSGTMGISLGMTWAIFYEDKIKNILIRIMSVLLFTEIIYTYPYRTWNITPKKAKKMFFLWRWIWDTFIMAVGVFFFVTIACIPAILIFYYIGSWGGLL